MTLRLPTRFLRLATATGVAAALAVLPAVAPAAADPYVEAVSGPSVSPAIGWAQLGLSDRMDIVGANLPADTSVPVPLGVVPSVLTGEVGSIVDVTDGRVDVLDGRGVVLGVIPLPAGAISVPFTIDTSAAQVVDGRAKLSFVVRDSGPAATMCTQPPAVTLSRLATTFSGPAPDPTTVAGFLPGYLDRVVVRVGTAPSPAVQQAALDLVAKLTRLYRPMPVRIDVAPGDEPGVLSLQSLSGTTRVIDIREGGRPGVTVENPGTPAAVLAITGTGEQLATQVGLFTDRRIGLAQGNSAMLVSSRDASELSSTMKTFGQLGISAQTSVAGTATLYTGFDAAAFGVGAINGAAVHLKAHYTPVVGGEGSVLVRSGDTVLATHTLDGSGTLDITGDIPAESITSNVGLALELRYIPRQDCPPLNDRVTFSIDPQSTVTVRPGAGNRGGFSALPMAFTPDFEVAIDSPEHLRYAAAALNLIAQQTQITLHPRVTQLADTASSGSSALVVSGGQELADAGMHPPLLPGASDTVNVGDGGYASATTEVDLHAPLGMVQAFTDRGRSVVAVTGTGDWTLVDATLDHVRGLPNRWGSLTGDVVATGIAGQTVSLSVNEGDSMPHQPAPGTGWQWWAWASIATVGAAAVAAAATVLIRHRRRA
ncbi:cellulose biosynthesis cyclic di-GMP-binding regulatory protein BcsB [Mycolicibacterium sp. 018/SC-01/001]|uniref:cellulose biosynthesis cyclic di-GMP-binding regulatory protein BcsB n=1 Tax=Mycolicibacterium sp. 018/SC-01/001 TaxID=2592069 RepID=UPI00117E20D6|nr:cellulose biosynthesis cyclic di-GMP-binding regulatory protein BcsB [Mycolicibacterium sp. 018/SC-01/001]TRW82704.1 cellulose biosynthesis cyclic di-GMP-binding regulatory protein BcsB [Mycolicibacterium sp. 018/SC-01/001]